jgi:hypothetical protein
MKNLTKTERKEIKRILALQELPFYSLGKEREKAVEKANAKILLIFLYLLLSISILWLAYLLGTTNGIVYMFLISSFNTVLKSFLI